MLEHKTVLSFQVTRNGNQTGNRLCFLSLLLYYLWLSLDTCSTAMVTTFHIAFRLKSDITMHAWCSDINAYEF